MRTLPIALRTASHSSGSAGILAPALLTSLLANGPVLTQIDEVFRNLDLLSQDNPDPNEVKNSTLMMTQLLLRESFSAYPQQDADQLVKTFSEYMEAHEPQQKCNRHITRLSEVSEKYAVLMHSLYRYAQQHVQKKDQKPNFFNMLQELLTGSRSIPSGSHLNSLIDEAFHRCLDPQQEMVSPMHHFTFRELSSALLEHLRVKGKNSEDNKRKAEDKSDAAHHSTLLRKGRSALTSLGKGELTPGSEKRLLTTALYCILRRHLPGSRPAELSTLAGKIIRYYADDGQNVTLINSLCAQSRGKAGVIHFPSLTQAVRERGIPASQAKLKEILGDKAPPEKLLRYTNKELMLWMEKLINHAETGRGEFPLKENLPPEATRVKHDEPRQAWERVQKYQGIEQAVKNIIEDLPHLFWPSRFKGVVDTPEYKQNQADRAYLLKACVSKVLVSAAKDAPDQLRDQSALTDRIISTMNQLLGEHAEDFILHSVNEQIVRVQHKINIAEARRHLTNCDEKLKKQGGKLRKFMETKHILLFPRANNSDNLLHSRIVQEGEWLINDRQNELDDARKALQEAEKKLNKFNGQATGLNFDTIVLTSGTKLKRKVQGAIERASQGQFRFQPEIRLSVKLLEALAIHIEQASVQFAGGKKYAITLDRVGTINAENDAKMAASNTKAKIREWMRYAQASPAEIWEANRAQLPSSLRLGDMSEAEYQNVQDGIAAITEAFEQLSRLQYDNSPETWNEVAANLQLTIGMFKSSVASTVSNSSPPDAGRVPSEAAAGSTLSSAINRLKEFLKPEPSNSAWPFPGASGAIGAPTIHCPEGTGRSITGICQPILDFDWDDMSTDYRNTEKEPVNVNSRSIKENSEEVENFLKKNDMMIPNIKSMANETLAKIINRRTGRNIDPGICMLACYPDSVSSRTAFTGWAHYRKPISSTQLVMLMYTNAGEMRRLKISDENMGCIITTKNPHTQTIKDNDIVPLLPSDLLEDIYEVDFYNVAREAIEKYYENSKQIVISKLFNLITTLSTSLLSPKHHLDVLKGVGLLKGKDVSTYLLDINGYASSDAYVFINNINKNVTLYLPRSTNSFYSFNNTGDMRNWIIDKCKTENGRNEISSHFSFHNKNDGFWRYGIREWVNKISGEWLTSKNHIATNSHPVSKINFFKDSVTKEKERMLSDIDVAIKSKSEQDFSDWEEFIDSANAFPNPFTLIASPIMHIIHAFTADTWEEEKKELGKIAGDAINLALMVAIDKIGGKLSIGFDSMNEDEILQMVRNGIEAHTIELNNERYAFERKPEGIYKNILASDDECYIEYEGEGFIPVAWSPADEGFIEIDNNKENTYSKEKYSVYRNENGNFKKTEVFIENEESQSCKNVKSNVKSKRSPTFPCLPSLSKKSEKFKSDLTETINQRFKSRKNQLTAAIDERQIENIKRTKIKKQSDYLEGHNNYIENLPSAVINLEELNTLELKRIATAQNNNLDYICGEKEFGALTRLIEGKEPAEFVASQSSLIQRTLVEWYTEGFDVEGLPQDWLISAGLLLSEAGRCLPLRELMCIAFDADKVEEYINQYRRYGAAPGSATTEHFLNILGNMHGNSDISKASQVLKKPSNKDGLYSIDEVIELFYKDFEKNTEVFLGVDSFGGEKKTGHSMLLVKKDSKITFYDPNFGIVTCENTEDLRKILQKHLIQKKFAHKYSAHQRDDGAYEFTIKIIDPKKLRGILIPYERNIGGVKTTAYEKLIDVASDESKFKVDQSTQIDMEDSILMFYYDKSLPEEFELFDSNILDNAFKERKIGWSEPFWIFNDRTFIKSGSRYYEVVSQDGWMSVRLKRKDSPMPGPKLRSRNNEWIIDLMGFMKGGAKLKNNEIRSEVIELKYATEEEINNYVGKIQEIMGDTAPILTRGRIKNIINNPSKSVNPKNGYVYITNNKLLNDAALRSALGSNYIISEPSGLQEMLHASYWEKIAKVQSRNEPNYSFEKSKGRTLEDLKKDLPSIADKISNASSNKNSALKIYRGMSPEEWDLILDWYKCKLSKFEKSFIDKDFNDLISADAIPIGNHASDIGQAMKYGECLVEITLREGVDDIIFTSDILALAPTKIKKEIADISKLIAAHYPEGKYNIASLHEGGLKGYIGLKREGDNFSFGFGSSEASRILLSLLIKNVRLIGSFSKSSEGFRVFKSGN